MFKLLQHILSDNEEPDPVNEGMASDSPKPENSARLKLITSDNDYIKEMLDCVPANFYFSGTTREKLHLQSQSSSESDKGKC